MGALKTDTELCAEDVSRASLSLCLTSPVQKMCTAASQSKRPNTLHLQISSIKILIPYCRSHRHPQRPLGLWHAYYPSTYYTPPLPSNHHYNAVRLLVSRYQTYYTPPPYCPLGLGGLQDCQLSTAFCTFASSCLNTTTRDCYKFTHTLTHTHTFTHTYVHIYIHTYIYLYLYLYRYTYICISC